jgi:exopolysaccharide production protein ExoQ
MTAAVSSAEDQFRLDRFKRLMVCLLLIGVFFVGEGYNFFYKITTAGDERAVTTLIDSGGGGLRPLMFAALGALGAICWMWRPANLRTNVHGWLPLLIFLFVSYAALSILWAEDQEIVIRRVAILLLTCLGVFGLVHRFSNRDFVMFCFVAGALLGSASVAAEIATGEFKPWTSEYRLYGIMHANTLGTLLVMFVMAAITLRRTSERHRTWYLVWIIVGIVLMVLTKSRTALIGLLAALWVWTVFGSTNRKRLFALLLLSAALIIPAAILLFGETIGLYAKQTILMGRESESPESLTGRVPLWGFLIDNYLDVRPLFGYGFQGFWTPGHVVRVSASQDWLIMHGHSGYLDLLLDLGYVGLALMIAILIAAARRAYVYFRGTNDPTWLFMMSLVVMAIIMSFLDTHLLTSSLRNLIWLVAFAKLAVFDPRFVRVRQAAYA